MLVADAFLAVLCGSAAIVQGMDQSVVNGAQMSVPVIQMANRGASSGLVMLTCVQIL